MTLKYYTIISYTPVFPWINKPNKKSILSLYNYFISFIQPVLDLIAQDGAFASDTSKYKFYSTTFFVHDMVLACENRQYDDNVACVETHLWNDANNIHIFEGKETVLSGVLWKDMFLNNPANGSREESRPSICYGGVSGNDGRR